MPDVNVLVDKVEFDTSLLDFIEQFWDSDYYEKTILTEKLLEEDVTVSPWESVISDNPLNPKYERNTTSKHPLPISAALNIPMHTETSKHQSVEYNCELGSFEVIEISTITGVPFVEIDVILKWTVVEHSVGRCQLVVTVHFIFKSLTLLQGLIESISLRELTNLFDIWIETAKSIIEENKSPSPTSVASVSSSKEIPTKQLTNITDIVKTAKPMIMIIADSADENRSESTKDLEKSCNSDVQSVYDFWWGSQTSK